MTPLKARARSYQTGPNSRQMAEYSEATGQYFPQSHISVVKEGKSHYRPGVTRGSMPRDSASVPWSLESLELVTQTQARDTNNVKYKLKSTNYPLHAKRILTKLIISKMGYLLREHDVSFIIYSIHFK